MKVSIPRLRRVRFKDGRTIEVMRQRYDSGHTQAFVRETVAEHFEKATFLSGCALVLWSPGNHTTVQVLNNGAVPGELLPDFVRTALLCDETTRWSTV